MKPEKISTSVIRKKRLIIFASLIFLLILTIHSGCAEKYRKNVLLQNVHPDPVFNRSLSESEMSLPFEGYRRDFSGGRTLKLDFNAPREKPEVQWSRKVNYTGKFSTMIVDSTGSTWFSIFSSNREIYDSDESYEMYQTSEPRPISTTLRIDPDNSISWKRDVDRVLPYYFPKVVSDSAVIWLVKTNLTDGLSFSDFIGLVYKSTLQIPPHDFSLECIDTEGNTVWRSQPAKVDKYIFDNDTVCRISENRIIMAVGNIHSGKFNIYSLSDGTLIETLKIPGWNSGENMWFMLSPIELPGKGWVGYQKDGIVLFNSVLRPVWKYKIAIEELQSQPVVLRDILIFSTNDYIAALNLNTGEIVWKRDEYNNAEIHAAEPDNNFIFFTASSSNEQPQFYNLDYNGVPIFSATYQRKKHILFKQYHNTIVYDDGSVLFNDLDSLDLYNKSGSLQWSLSLKDLGFSTESYTIEDTLSYAPDGRIVICITSDNLNSDKNDYLLSLKTKE